jgi:DNA-binding winged helix-turn-helix (wHTH) protein
VAKQEHLIGRWRFDPDEAVLRSEGSERRLEDRAARALELLCERRGEIVSKDELLDVVWGGRLVSTNSVAIVIGDLRRALDDDPRAPVHIVTINKRGYRLAAVVATAAHEVDRSPRRRIWGRVASAAVVASAVGLVIGSHRISRAPVELVLEPTRNETGRADYNALARALDAAVTDRVTHFRGVRALAAPAVSSGGERLVLNSRLILWNGAPELAMTATDMRTRAVVWSAFAGGRVGDLARAAASRLSALQERLAR